MFAEINLTYLLTYLPPDNLELFMDNEKLEKVQSTKFLGIHFDQHFTWDVHLDHLRKKMSRGAFAINMSKHILSEKHLKMIYHTLVQSHLTYGILLWGNTYKKYLDRVAITQKKSVRAVAGARYNATSSPIFKRLGILKLTELYKLYVGDFMYGFVNNQLPSQLQTLFHYHGQGHEHNTRQSTDPRTPNATSELMRRSFLYAGPTQWLTLTDSLKSLRTKQMFKSALKRSYIGEY